MFAIDLADTNSSFPKMCLSGASSQCVWTVEAAACLAFSTCHTCISLHYVPKFTSTIVARARDLSCVHTVRISIHDSHQTHGWYTLVRLQALILKQPANRLQASHMPLLSNRKRVTSRNWWPEALHRFDFVWSTTSSVKGLRCRVHVHFLHATSLDFSRLRFLASASRLRLSFFDCSTFACSGRKHLPPMILTMFSLHVVHMVSPNRYNSPLVLIQSHRLLCQYLLISFTGSMRTDWLFFNNIGSSDVFAKGNNLRRLSFQNLEMGSWDVVSASSCILIDVARDSNRFTACCAWVNPRL